MQYNRRLSAFNANICLHKNKIQVNLNLQWKDIDDEIKIGLIQHLLLKILKKKGRDTPNIGLYNNFLKNIPLLTPKTKTNPTLDMSFFRVNEKFFDFGIEKPNLQWGKSSFRKLASYNFHDDTVTVSSIFQEAREEILDYLMYHELLHKHHKFTHKKGRSRFHTTAFRNDEASYPYQKEIEREIDGIIREKRIGIRKVKRIVKKKTTLWDFFRN